MFWDWLSVLPEFICAWRCNGFGIEFIETRNKGDLENARINMQKALDLEPSDVISAINLSIVLKQLDQQDEADELIQRIVEDPNATDRRGLAVSSYHSSPSLLRTYILASAS